MFVYAKAPTIAVIDGIFSSEECLQIIEHSRSKLKRSTVVTDDGLVPDKDRTSYGAFLPHSDFPELCQRVADIAAIPIEAHIKPASESNCKILQIQFTN